MCWPWMLLTSCKFRATIMTSNSGNSNRALALPSKCAPHELFTLRLSFFCCRLYFTDIVVTVRHGHDRERNSFQKGRCAVGVSDQCWICHTGNFSIPSHCTTLSFMCFCRNIRSYSKLYHSGPKRYWCVQMSSFIPIFFCPALFQLANKYWAPHSKNKLPFDPKVSKISNVLSFCTVYAILLYI